MFWKLVIATLSIVFVMQACGFKPKPEEACNFVENSSNQRVSWNSRVPITLYIHESVPIAYREALDRAMEKWRLARGMELFKIGGIVNGASTPTQDGNSVIYWENSWDDNRQFEQGQTTIHWAGTQIFEADMMINDEDFNYSDAEPGAPGYVDIESLFVHELGHVLGLAHNEAKGSVMAAILPKATIRRDPGQQDLDSLKCEY